MRGTVRPRVAEPGPGRCVLTQRFRRPHQDRRFPGVTRGRRATSSRAPPGPKAGPWGSADGSGGPTGERRSDPDRAIAGKWRGADFVIAGGPNHLPAGINRVNHKAGTSSPSAAIRPAQHSAAVSPASRRTSLSDGAVARVPSAAVFHGRTRGSRHDGREARIAARRIGPFDIGQGGRSQSSQQTSLTLADSPRRW